MVCLDDLTGLDAETKRRAIECLDSLLTFTLGDGISQIITGYNYYCKIPEWDNCILLSHIHSTDQYKSDMVQDLRLCGYVGLDDCIREKAGTYLHDPDFNIRDEGGNLLKGVRVRDLRSGNFIDLQKYSDPLENYPEFEDSERKLLAETQGWELNIPFHTEEELFELIGLFDERSRRDSKRSWTGAYRIPVLLLGESAFSYFGNLKGFIPATRIILVRGGNEISFVINKNLERLRCLPHYRILLELGFKEEICLGNNVFIQDYVDSERQV